MRSAPRYPGIRVTANGNQLVSYHTETRISDAGVFYPITPSTEGGELYQQSFAEGRLNVFGRSTLAVEAEGEHTAQGGAIDKVPMAFQKVNAIFSTPERKSPGAGGIFSIFVTDLCKGCAACVTACGEHEALKMVDETEAINGEHETGTTFLNLLPDTPQKYLGLYNDQRPQDSKTATLRNMLMVRRNYDALVSGDGACAGCGEKSVLHAIAAVTEAYMRPLYHAKADRLEAKAAEQPAVS